MEEISAGPRPLNNLKKNASKDEQKKASLTSPNTATRASGPKPWPTVQSEMNAAAPSPPKEKPVPRTYKRAPPKRVAAMVAGTMDGDGGTMQQEENETDASHLSVGSVGFGTPPRLRKDSSGSFVPEEKSLRSSGTVHNQSSERRSSPSSLAPSRMLKDGEQTQSSGPASSQPSPRKREAAVEKSVSHRDQSQPGEMTPLCPPGRQGSTNGTGSPSSVVTAAEVGALDGFDEAPSFQAQSGQNFLSGLFAHIKRHVAGGAPPSSVSDASEEAAITEPMGQAQTAVNSIMEKALRVKAQMKRSPYLVSLAVIGASFGALWAGFFGVISCFFSLHPFIALIKLYQLVFSTICLGTELARYSSAFGIRSLLKQWAPVLELTVGRGFIQLLTGGLALGVCRFGFIEWLPGLVLCVTSLFNVAWGVKSACKLRELMVKLKEQMQQSEEDVENDAAAPGQKILTTATVRRLARKFRALDVNGDGRLSRDEVAAGCRSLNIALDEGDVDMMFTLLDRKKRGYIDIDDFEMWWYKEKSPFSVLV